MHLSNEHQQIIQKALNNLADFTRLYGDDESEELLEFINTKIFKKAVPPKTVLIKLSFSSLLDSNIFSRFWRTHKFVSSSLSDGHIVELKVQGALAQASESHIRMLFDCSSKIIDTDDVSDYDQALLDAYELTKKGAKFISTSTID
jgi:hypothetical protein